MTRVIRSLPFQPADRPRGCQRGISLIEVMVAVTISLILLAGVTQIFISNRQAYRTQEALNVLQENGRFAVQLIGRSLRMADHWAGVEARDVKKGSFNITGINGCNAAWITDAQEAIRGYDGADTNDGAATNPLPSGCLHDDDYVPHSDILVVRYADLNPIDVDDEADYDNHAAIGTVPSDDLDVGDNANRIFVRTSAGRVAYIFQGSQKNTVLNQLKDEEAAYNYRYAISVFFVRPCSTPKGERCAADDDGGRPIPTLTRLTLRGTTFQQEPLVEGIEQMQLEYGEDTDNDGRADQFRQTAAAVTDWRRVVSVRISLIVRGNQTDPTYADTKTYNMAGGYAYTALEANRHYPRKHFTDLIQIRNRTKS